MDSWIRALKIFCIVGGVALVLGTATLIWLLMQRQQARQAGLQPPPSAAMLDLPLPEGLRIVQSGFDGRHALLLLQGPDQQQYLALVNPATGERLSLLRIVAEPR